MKKTRTLTTICLITGIAFISLPISAEKNLISEDTGTCIDCHASLHPGIVGDWKKSLHSKLSVETSLKKNNSYKRISSENIPEKLKKNSVGCAECHTANRSKHKDTFEHNGYNVHIIVTPEDCAVCHSTETDQYSRNIMSHAYGNFVNNPVYNGLEDSINGPQHFSKGAITGEKANDETRADSCLYCHGTNVKVMGTRTIDHEMGEMTVPVLSGWPNQGVGRINPDGSKGACTSCHPRHSFSSEIARKPDTCAECHKGPDVPAYKVYKVSKHGNIYSSQNKEWNFKSSPWKVGTDFTAPTCSTCHVSHLVDSDGETIAERTHQMNDRLAWRNFGLIYAHPHPRSPDTTVIKNKAGLNLPTELTGEPVSEFLIDTKEQEKRRKEMVKVCNSCHSESWVRGQFKRLDNTVKTTNEMTLTATKILLKAWETGAAKGLAQKDSIFNETIEKMWVEQWLFYSNTTRFATAMVGADYGVFASGRWNMAKNIQAMKDWLYFKIHKGSMCKKKGCSGKCPKKK